MAVVSALSNIRALVAMQFQQRTRRSDRNRTPTGKTKGLEPHRPFLFLTVNRSLSPTGPVVASINSGNSGCARNGTACAEPALRATNWTTERHRSKLRGYQNSAMSFVRVVSAPNIFFGVQTGTRLDSRLEHAGMTAFGGPMDLTRQTAANQPGAIEGDN
jgi:hypothetical protein